MAEPATRILGIEIFECSPSCFCSPNTTLLFLFQDTGICTLGNCFASEEKLFKLHGIGIYIKCDKIKLWIRCFFSRF